MLIKFGMGDDVDMMMFNSKIHTQSGAIFDFDVTGSGGEVTLWTIPDLR